MAKVKLNIISGNGDGSVTSCRALQVTGVIDYSEYINREDPSCFKDDLSKLTPTMFVNRGVKCPCKKTTCHTRGELAQHITSNKHKEWLEKETAKLADPIKVRRELELEKRNLHKLNTKQDFRIRALERQLREAGREITSQITEKVELQEELDTYKIAVDTLCTKLDESERKVGEYKAWIKTGVREVMGLDWESSDDENDSEDDL